MFSSSRAKENGGPTPKRMKTRQNKDSVREMGEVGWDTGAKLELWDGAEAHGKAQGQEFGLAECQGFGRFEGLGDGAGVRGDAKQD